MHRILALALLVAPLTAGAAKSPDDLTSLRLEVESLARTLDDHRATTTSSLTALRTERAELQRQLRLAKVRNRTLLRLEQQDAAADLARQASADEWNAPARAAVALVRTHVERSLPFAHAARLATLDRIAADLATAIPDTGRAMERLWRFVEEEAAMAREVTVARQQVELDGEPRLCDVLRIGMALLYVRSEDGRIAWASRYGDAWRIEPIVDEASRLVVDALFTAAAANEIFGPIELIVPPEVDDAR